MVGTGVTAVPVGRAPSVTTRSSWLHACRASRRIPESTCSSSRSNLNGPSFQSGWCADSSFLSVKCIRKEPSRSATRTRVLAGSVAFHWPAEVVNAVNVYALGLYSLLVLSSIGLRYFRLTLRRLKTEVLLLPVCIAYLFLLFSSWKPDTVSILFPGSLHAGLEKGFNPQFFPTLPGISHLFSRCEITASSMWLHLLAVNLFAAVQIGREGLKKNIFTLHSILLCVFSGVLGFFSHFVTKILSRRGSKNIQKGEGYTMYKFNDDG